MIEQANLSDLEAITQIYNEYILEKTATADIRLVSKSLGLKPIITLAKSFSIKKMIKF